MKRLVSLLMLILTGAIVCTSCSSPSPSKSKVKAKKAHKVEVKEVKDPDLTGDGFILDSSKMSLQDAVRKYSKKTGRTVTNTADLLVLADEALDDTDYGAGETILNEAIRQDPNNGTAYFLRGRARIHMVVEDRLAQDDLERGLSLGAGGASAYKFLAFIYDAHKETQKAADALAKAIELDPSKEEYYRFHAALCVSLGKIALAKNDYDRAIRLRGNNPNTYFMRGQLRETLKDYKGALSDYDAALKLQHKTARLTIAGMAYKRRAQILGRLGKHQQAIDELTEAIAYDRFDEELIRYRGQHYASLGQYKRAIADFDKAIAMAPEFARSTFEARASAYEKLGKKELAEKDRQEAKRLMDKPAEKPLFQFKDPATKEL